MVCIIFSCASALVYLCPSVSRNLFQFHINMYISTLVCIYIHVAFGFNMAHQVPKARRNKLQLAMCTIC